jgi:hypothetical protein
MDAGEALVRFRLAQGSPSRSRAERSSAGGADHRCGLMLENRPRNFANPPYGAAN